MYYDPGYCDRYYYSPSTYDPPRGAVPLPGYGLISANPPAAAPDAGVSSRVPGGSIPDGVAARVPLLFDPDAPEALPEDTRASQPHRQRGTDS